jgi:hypothetical protein
MGTVLTESWQEITRKSSKNTPCWRGWRLVPQSVKSFDRINRIEKMKPKAHGNAGIGILFILQILCI